MPAKSDHLVWLQIDQHGHQQPLTLDALDFALAQDLLEEHALVGDMLVDDPEALVVDGENERLAQLPQRLERCERVEVRWLAAFGQRLRIPAPARNCDQRGVCGLLWRRDRRREVLLLPPRF